LIVFFFLMILQKNRWLIAITKENNILKFDGDDFSPIGCLIGYHDEVIRAKCMSDNQHVLVATNSAEVRYVNMNNQNTRLMPGHKDTVLSLDVSRDGRFAVTSSKDRTVRIWDMKTFECVHALVGHSGMCIVHVWVCLVCFCPCVCVCVCACLHSVIYCDNALPLPWHRHLLFHARANFRRFY
jgi:WD40 repeat protein